MRPTVIGLVALPVIVGGLGITTAVVVFSSGSAVDQNPAAPATAAKAEAEATTTSGGMADAGRVTESELHDTRIDGTRPHLTVIQGGANSTGLGAIPAILSALPPLAADLAPLAAAERGASAFGDSESRGNPEGRQGRPRGDTAPAEPARVAPSPADPPPAAVPGRIDRPGSAEGERPGEPRGSLPLDPLDTRVGPPERPRLGEGLLPGLGPRLTSPDGSPPQQVPLDGARRENRSGHPAPDQAWKNPLHKTPRPDTGPRIEGAPRAAPHAATGRQPGADVGGTGGRGPGGARGGGDYADTAAYLRPEAG